MALSAVLVASLVVGAPALAGRGVSGATPPGVVKSVGATSRTSSDAHGSHATASPTAEAAVPFEIAAVVARDTKSLDVVFSDVLAVDLQNLIVDVPNAFLRYVRISGGTVGQPDALLNGQFLTTARATAQIVALEPKVAVRVIFTGTGGNAITLQGGATYELWLDSNNNAPTTLSAATLAGATTIRVASVLDLAPGQTVQIDTGPSAEIAVVSAVGTGGATGTGVTLAGPLDLPHASGAAVAVTADSRSLGSLLFRSEAGETLEEVEDHATAPVMFAGSSTVPALAAIESAEFVTSRIVRVTFNGTILANMAYHVYTTNRMTLATSNPASSMAPRYVDLVPNSDKRTYDLYFPADVAAADAYTLTILANPNSTSNTATLRTSAGIHASAATPLTAALDAPATVHPEPAIASASVNEHRNEIALVFTTKLDRFTIPGHTPACSTPGGTPPACVNPLSVIESTNNIGGRVLTRGQLLDVVSFDGLAIEEGGAIEDWLRDQPAFMPDARTIVVTLRNEAHLARGTTGTVTLIPDRVVDKAQKSNTSPGTAVAVGVPDSDVPSSAWDPDAEEYLTVNENSSVTFERYDYRFNPDGRQLVTTVPDRTVAETVDAIVVDTKYLNVTFVPDFGGRLLSMVYKPTGNDLLYKNPVVVPYQINTTVFYNRWLAVWGGIFPTFSEPEHGKYWFDPWDATVTETADAVKVQLFKADTLNYASRPGNYNNGATRLELTVTYTVHRTSPVVDMDVQIHNPNATSRNYEYWTCTTLAPGMNGDGDVGSPTMQIVAPVDTVTHDSAYSWMRSVDTRATGGSASTLDFENLSYMTNWMANGIAYGNDLATGSQKGWWGVINHENDEGILRIATSQGETQTVTPGMKLWEWGYESSFGTGDPNTLTNPTANNPPSLGANDVASPHGSNRYLKGDSPAPYIEIWPGVSNHFFTDATIAGGATLNFTDSYMPTMDLADVTNANGSGAAHVKVTPHETNATVTADVWSTHIGRPLTARLVDTKTGNTIAERTFVGDAYRSVRLTGLMAGGRSARVELSDGGGVLLTATEAIPASVPDDTVAPTTSATLAPEPVGGYHDDPTVRLTATDDSSGVAATEYRLDGGSWTPYSAPFEVTGDGSHVLEYRSGDIAGNVEATQELAFDVDATAPTIEIVAPVEAVAALVGGSGNYPLGSLHMASYSCADNLSGVASCIGTVANGGPLDSSSVGFHEFAVTAVDVAGHTTTISVTYNVVWAEYGGLMPPLVEGGTTIGKAGSNVPIKFSLGANYGTAGILADGFPVSMPVGCSTGEVTGAPVAAASDSGLVWGHDKYQFDWKTVKAWQGTCRRLVIKLADNTVHAATIRFE